MMHKLCKVHRAETGLTVYRPAISSAPGEYYLLYVWRLSMTYCRAVNRQPGFRPMDLAELVQHSELIWKRMLMTS